MYCKVIMDTNIVGDIQEYISMDKRKPVSKTLTEQVADELLSLIKDKEEFDSEMIERIGKLAEEGRLKRAEQVISVIKPKKEDHE